MAMQVVARSSKLWSEDADKAALHKRTTFVGGDFFNSGVLLVGLLGAEGYPCVRYQPTNNLQHTGCK